MTITINLKVSSRF